MGWVALLLLLVLVAAFLSISVKVLREYERAVIFRVGRLRRGRGPGARPARPVRRPDGARRPAHRHAAVPQQDVITNDNVPVQVTAVAYFRVIHPSAAVVQIEDYMEATSQIAQTTLRSVLGQHSLDELLAERDKINEILQGIIDQHTAPWGIKISVVEVKDVELPANIQRAMAREAEAERERRAKLIGAEGEFEAATTSSARRRSSARARSRCSCATCRRSRDLVHREHDDAPAGADRPHEAGRRRDARRPGRAQVPRRRRPRPSAARAYSSSGFGPSSLGVVSRRSAARGGAVRRGSGLGAATQRRRPARPRRVSSVASAPARRRRPGRPRAGAARSRPAWRGRCCEISSTACADVIPFSVMIMIVLPLAGRRPSRRRSRRAPRRRRIVSTPIVPRPLRGVLG